MIDKELLKILACPKCQKELKLNNKTQQLVCDNCKLGFRIKDSIPILLIEEAEDLS